ncbi:Oxidoreductase family, NAD-binding Rossmann fold [Paraburkholderia fungorum]|uniref:Oxidoreductase family, NAD-binding Rossmann fold n=1 Tax=Paraburkholderia fungorum TaxID=134537 RepID=A0A1H1JMI8_9BURK|nr:Gfo/Idh/MocA family oxidoreductase [Paraburkholderia fungorum]SDR51241.1 Oxidoreductase family, NAD-binding Rossmann fold [Paraburkholderia fungorum]
MAQEKQLGIGLIGAGAIMRLSHIPTVMKSGIAKLVGIYDPSRERADALAESSGSRSFETLDALLDSSEIDAVIIATPNNRHEEAAVAAAKAGKHILCEKPLAIDIQSATRIVNAAKEAGVVLQVGFNQRFWSQVQIAKQLIDADFIGDVHAFRSVYSKHPLVDGVWTCRKGLPGKGFSELSNVHGNVQLRQFASNFRLYSSMDQVDDPAIGNPKD